LKKNLGRGLIDHGALVFLFSPRLPQSPLSSDGCQALVPGNDLAFDTSSKLLYQGARFLGRRAKRTIHVAGHTDDNCTRCSFGRKLGNAITRIASRNLDGFQRMREHAEIVADRNSHTSFAGINSENTPCFHFQLKIPHHKPRLRNNMSFLSFDKFGDNLPVTGIVAFSQAAIGFGVGLLIADKFDQAARQRTAVALIGAGAATVLPFLAGIITNINNRPDSSRRIRKQLASIRESTGLSNGHDAF
jgi:hypothetical protein